MEEENIWDTKGFVLRAKFLVWLTRALYCIVGKDIARTYIYKAHMIDLSEKKRLEQIKKAEGQQM